MADWVLGVETTAGQGCLALLHDGVLAASVGLDALGRRGAGLVPAAKALLAGAGLRPADLALVAVDVGPGSFTGIRVGIAFAKSLAYATPCPLAAVSSLEARARDAAPAGDGAIPFVLAVALDARRDRFYAAAFRVEGLHVARLFEDALFDRDTLHARLPAGSVWLGDAADRLVRPDERVHTDALRAPSAETVARLGLAGSGRIAPFALAPAYMRLVEAQEPRSP